LKYNHEDNAAQLCFSTEDKCLYFGQIKSGANGLEHSNVIECCNPNIFFEKDDKLLMCCNYKDPKFIEMHYLHKGDYNSFKITFDDDTRVTIQDFGLISENTYYLLGIEGEAGKSIKLKDDNRGHTVLVY